MKAPTLRISVILVSTFKDGTEKESLFDSYVGVYKTTSSLEGHFGIKTSPSTVHKAKKVFTPIKYPYQHNESFYKGYLNWVHNCPKELKASAFAVQKNAKDFIENNPIVEVKIRLQKTA